MDINNFISKFKNHPVLFIGTGVSLRYLETSFTWDALLKKISYELTGNNEKYLDLKSNCYEGTEYNYQKIASTLEIDFNKALQQDRNGKFKDINDMFYESMERGINLSRFKIYISRIFENLNLDGNKKDEVAALKRVRKNIGSIITTNYDKFIENIFEFNPLVGNDILLSNPYGSVYKIHGCISEPDKIIITSDDYDNFERKYELIRAQLLSLFIHNPIIFIGYSVGDQNVKDILKTIFTYVPPNSDIADTIRSNFLLVEHEKGSKNIEVGESDIVLDKTTTIRVNKLKTDNFMAIYEALSMLQLPVSAMDIRKVQNVVKEIYAGGNIKVSITENIEGLNNDDKVLVIGTMNTISYNYQTTSEMMENYFNIIEESNFQLLELIDKQTIQKTQYFPIYAFTLINPNINKIDELKENQRSKIDTFLNNVNLNCKTEHNTINEILNDENIAKSNKNNAILYSILERNISLDETEKYLRNFKNKELTDYRKLLCVYDYMKYGQEIKIVVPTT